MLANVEFCSSLDSNRVIVHITPTNPLARGVTKIIGFVLEAGSLPLIPVEPGGYPVWIYPVGASSLPSLEN